MGKSRYRHIAASGPSAADWADCYVVSVPEPDLRAIDAARRVLGSAPAWIRSLLALRNRLVAVAGLKLAELKIGAAETVGAFPIVSESDRQVVLGFDDKHLDFRIVVDVRQEDGRGSVVAVTTVVARHNLGGRAYIAVVTPFHKVIVKSLLNRLAART
ncbi:DUF2867 domain-containing protein [Rhizobium sp. SL42]|nr:DUF2867 domain-containing protein [Rhizobium sp. SL42]